jgi:hypothetical protein
MGCTCVQSYDAPGNVKFTEQQIQSLWVQAGGNPQAAAVAAAIAMIESGGNSTATCVNGGSGCSCNGCVDRGLWQIDSVHGSQSTYDPMGNARAAVSISGNGTNWGAWGNDYQKVTAAGVPPYNPDGSAPINATQAATNNAQGATTTQQAPITLDSWYCALLNPGICNALGIGGGSAPTNLLNPTTWFNPLGIVSSVVSMWVNPIIAVIAGVLGVTAGGIMMLFGLWVIMGNTRTGAQVERGAGKAAQLGLVAAAPETAASTQYMGQAKAPGEPPPVTTVTQRRRAAGFFTVGGQRVTYRPARVATSVEREGGRDYGDTFQGPGRPRTVNNEGDRVNNEAHAYTGRRRRQ